MGNVLSIDIGYVERGKNKKAAIIALMRKIIIIAYSIFKSGESFDEERYLKNFGGQNC